MTTVVGQRWAHRTSSLRALSYRFEVRCDDRELGRYVDDVLEGLRESERESGREFAPAEAAVPHWYSLTPSASASAAEEGRVDVRGDGGDLALAQQPGDAVGCVIGHVNRAAAEASSEHLLFHAGALDADGTGVLIPGPSGSGKSTLVAALANAGLAYLMDELAALDLSSGELQPYAKPITIKPGSFDAVSAVGVADWTDSSVLVGRWSGEEWQIPVGRGTRRAVGLPCAPGIVVVPRYEPAAATALTPLSDTDAFLYLGLNAVNLLRHGGAGTATLGGLAASCTCAALTFSDLDAACELVLNLVERDAGDVAAAARSGARAG